MNDLYPSGFALVIGGSGGVGVAICHELVANNIPVLLTYNSNRERAEHLVEELGGDEASVSCEQVTLQDLSTLNHAIGTGLAQHGRLHSVFIATGYDIPQSPISEVTPEFGSWGQPPASQSERAEGLDGLSSILQLALDAGRNADRPCGFGVRVFDGKQRYDLRTIHKEDMKRVRLKGYKGPAIACWVYYIPISGYDPEDLPDEKTQNTPLEIWFADTPQNGVFMPVRFEYPLDFGRAVLEVRKLEVQPIQRYADAN